MPEQNDQIKVNSVEDGSEIESSVTESVNAIAQEDSLKTRTDMIDKKNRSGVISELRQIQQDVKKYKTNDLIIPVMSIIFLSLLTIFVYIPMVARAVEYRSEVGSVQEKITKLTGLNSQLSQLDSVGLQQDLAVSRDVIPFSLQVSDFVLYINKLAEEKGLQFKEILAGDIQIRGKGESRDVDPVMKGVSGPLKYVGRQARVVSFLDELQNISPYIISADSVELKKLESGDWELSLLVTGYYLNQASLPALDIYSPYSSYTQYRSVIDIFRSKSQNR